MRYHYFVILTLFFFIGNVLFGLTPLQEPDAGSSSYLQHQVDKTDKSFYKIGQDGAVHYSYPVGNVSYNYSK